MVEVDIYDDAARGNDPQSHRGWRLPLPDGVPNNTTPLVLRAFVVAASGACRCHGFTVYSSNVAAQFILAFDLTGLPADATVPALVLPVNATSTVSAYFGTAGRWFSQGIVLCNSSTATAKTIGSADCLFDVQWE